MTMDATLETAAVLAVRQLAKLAKREPTLQAIPADELAGFSIDTGGVAVTCGTLVLQGRLYRLQLCRDTYVSPTPRLWYGASAGDRDSLARLEHALKADGRVPYRTYDGRSAYKKQKMYKLRMPFGPGDYGKLISEQYASDGEWYLGVYENEDAGKPEVVQHALQFWRQLARLSHEVAPALAADLHADLESKVKRLEKSLAALSTSDLISKCQLLPGGAPERRSAVTSVFDRNPLVVLTTKMRGGYKCEVPNCKAPAFKDSSGKHYVEVHHLTPLAKGGTDSIDNTACVCASHHRELHVGEKSREVAILLRELRQAEDRRQSAF